MLSPPHLKCWEPTVFWISDFLFFSLEYLQIHGILRTNLNTKCICFICTLHTEMDDNFFGIFSVLALLTETYPMTSRVEFSTLIILLVMRKLQHLEHCTLWLWGLRMLNIYRLDTPMLLKSSLYR